MSASSLLGCTVEALGRMSAVVSSGHVTDLSRMREKGMSASSLLDWMVKP